MYTCLYRHNIHIYTWATAKRGHTKHLMDGHWFVEIYGIPSITREAMGPFQISDAPFQGNVTLNIDFWRRFWTRFGPKRACAPQKVFFLISMEWSAEKGIRRSGSQVPVNMFVCLFVWLVGWLIVCLFVSLAACTSSLACFHWLSTWTCTISIASPLTLSPHCCCLVNLLTLASYCRCFMQLLCDRSTTASTDIKLGKSWGEF